MIGIQLLQNRRHLLLIRLVLDRPERLLKIRKRDLSLSIDLDHLERTSNLGVVGFELSVDLGEHGSDSLREGGVDLVCFVRVGFGVLFRLGERKEREGRVWLVGGSEEGEMDGKKKVGVKRKRTCSDAMFSSIKALSSFLSLTMEDLADKIESASASS